MKCVILASAALTLASAGLAQTKPAAAAKPIAKADYLKSIDTRFGNIDANHDGFLTSAELAAAEVRIEQQLTAARTQRLRAEFTQLDTNKDGKLSFDEFIAAAPPFKPRETPAQIIQQIDANKDGKISAAEFRANQMAPFNKLDLNHDGVLTPEEAQKANGGK